MIHSSRKVSLKNYRAPVSMLHTLNMSIVSNNQEYESELVAQYGHSAPQQQQHGGGYQQEVGFGASVLVTSCRSFRRKG